MFLKVHTFRKTVGVAGTRERLTALDVKTAAVTLQALLTNTGIVYVGGDDVSSINGIELSPGDSISIGKEILGLADAKISLTDIWADVASNDEGLNVLYLERG